MFRTVALIFFQFSDNVDLG